MLVVNSSSGRESLRLLGLAGRVASAALAVALHRLAFAACGDAVPNLLGNPTDDGIGRLGTDELFPKLSFKLFDV